MKQSVPEVVSADVERIVLRDFLRDEAEAVKKALHEYGTETWHREPIRVHLAALKVASGDAGRLRYAIDSAKRDYRDLLTAAEYPNYRRLGPGTNQLSEEEKAQINESDRLQYDEWLKRPA